MFVKSLAIIGTMVFSTGLISYQQNLCINSELLVEKGISIEDKVINKNYDHLKENLKIPQLKNDNNNSNIDEVNKFILNDIMPMITDAESTSKEYFEELNEMPSYSYEINYDYNISLNNQKLISIYSELYQFLGGAHGSTIRYSYTIDKQNLKIIYLKDLFKEDYDYKTYINAQIKKQINEKLKEEPGMFFDNGNDFKGVNEKSSYYLDKSNLIIYFQQYEIGPYASGIIEFKIPLNEFKDNFKY